MKEVEENKSKRVNIRLTPKDHSWLFKLARKRKTTVSALFEKFIVYLKRKHARD